MSLASFDVSARVALFLLSLASRPLPEDFPNASAEVVRISRRDLHRLSLAASVGLGLHAFNAALSDLAGYGENVPALRLVSHAGSVFVDLGLLDLDDDAEAAWLALLSDAEALGSDADEDDDSDVGEEAWLAETRAALPALGLDVETPLPSGLFDPAPGHHLQSARRCVRCHEVKSAEAFGNNGSRLLSRCLPCDRESSREWRRVNPEKANAPRYRKRPEPQGIRPRGFTLS